MIDFFISYTSADRTWAGWIAWVLEQNGYKVVYQEWDFAAGSNFVLEMQKAAAAAHRTIAVLTPDYLSASRFGASEWAAAFSDDPDGMKRRLVPVRVQACTPDGLLKSIIYIDLVGLDEQAAEEKLLDHIKGARRKPAERPSFPGATPVAGAFPEPTGRASTSDRANGYMPKIRGTITDRDRRQFMKDAFATIRRHFESSLAELARRNRNVEFDLTPVDATKFTVEIFVGGKSNGRCKIWMGGMLGGDDISYAEGTPSLHSTTMNETLTLRNSEELVLSATLGMFSGRADDGLDLKRLSPEQGAEYLWRRFSSTLER